MFKRTLLVLAACSSLFACAGEAPSDPKHSAENKQTASSPSDTSNSSSSASTSTTSNGPLDGTWDITASGSGPIGASEMTVKGGKVTGMIVMDQGGGVDDDDCSITKDRMSFDLAFSGDTMTGTFTHEWGYRSPSCGDSLVKSADVTATRTHADSNASGQTMVEGDWVLQLGPGAAPIAVSVAGLVAKAWDSASRTGAPVVTTTVTNSAATSAASDRDLSFAARKR